MRAPLFVFLSLLFLSCTPITETNWSFLPQINNTWYSLQTFGGSDEDIAHGIIKTKDGGFALIGNTKSTDGHFAAKERAGSDLFLMKFNAASQLEWTQIYGGSGDDRGQDLVQLEDGGYALIGYSKSSDGDASVNKGQHDNWLLRTNAQGKLLWERSFGFLGHDHAYNIIATTDGGLLFNGFLDVTASNGLGQDKREAHFNQKHGVGEYWVHKIDVAGNLQWRRYYGGTNNDRSYDALEAQDGGYVLVGASESKDVDIKNPKGSYDIWVVKVDQSGSLLWERSIGGTAYDKGQALIETSDGDYIVLGQSFSNDGDISEAGGSSDIVLARLSSSGDLLQLRTLGSIGFETATSLVQRKDNNLLILGQSNALAITEGPMSNDVVLYYTLPNGALINSAQLYGEGLDEGNDLLLTEAGKVIVVGSTQSSSGDYPISLGDKDLFIAFWH